MSVFFFCSLLHILNAIIMNCEKNSHRYAIAWNMKAAWYKAKNISKFLSFASLRDSAIHRYVCMYGGEGNDIIKIKFIILWMKFIRSEVFCTSNCINFILFLSNFAYFNALSGCERRKRLTWRMIRCEWMQV